VERIKEFKGPHDSNFAINYELKRQVVLCYTLQSPHSPNRELLFTGSSRTVQKIHTQTDQTPAIVDLT
jgi:hypothetical protein